MYGTNRVHLIVKGIRVYHGSKSGARMRGELDRLCTTGLAWDDVTSQDYIPGLGGTSRVDPHPSAVYHDGLSERFNLSNSSQIKEISWKSTKDAASE